MAQDEFNDIKNSSLGIFGGGGPGMESPLKSHDAVQHEVIREGLALEFNCPGCGLTTQLMLEWPELVAMKYGHNPALVFRGHPEFVRDPMSMVWEAGESGWRPEAACRHCGFKFCIRLSSQEPEQALRVGRQRNFINPDGERQVSALCVKSSQPQGQRGWAVPPQR